MAADKNSEGKAPETASTPIGDPDQLSLAELARAILAREFRPRVAHIRQLAEAVLHQGEALLEAEKQLAAKLKKSKSDSKKKDAKTASAKKKKGSGKKRKLAKIPGQKSKK